MNGFSEDYTDIKVVKLSNGENIIGYVREIDDVIEVEDPLQMQIFSKLTDEGVVEGLNLTRWLQPFSEESTFYVRNRNVVVTANASPGLIRYYEYSLKRFDDGLAPNPANVKQHKETLPTNEELDDIDREVYNEELEALLDDLDTKTIH